MPDLASSFRAAVSSGEFQRAQEIWNLYAGECLAEVRGGCGDRLPEAQALLEWTHKVVLCCRAQALHTLRLRMTEAHAADAYLRSAR